MRLSSTAVYPIIWSSAKVGVREASDSSVLHVPFYIVQYQTVGPRPSDQSRLHTCAAEDCPLKSAALEAAMSEPRPGGTSTRYLLYVAECRPRAFQVPPRPLAPLHRYSHAPHQPLRFDVGPRLSTTHALSHIGLDALACACTCTWRHLHTLECAPFTQWMFCNLTCLLSHARQDQAGTAGTHLGVSQPPVSLSLLSLDLA